MYDAMNRNATLNFNEMQKLYPCGIRREKILKQINQGIAMVILMRFNPSSAKV